MGLSDIIRLAYSKTMRSNFKRIIHISSLFIIACVIITYSFYQSRFLLEGPQVAVWDPQNGSTVFQSVLDIQGEVKNISKLSLDGRQIFVNEQGVFKERILLSVGLNSITIEAQDKFGREIQKTVELFFKDVRSETDTLTRN